MFSLLILLKFRETHHISGACVRAAEDQKIKLDQLTLQQLQSIDSRFEPDVMEVWNYEVSVERKNSIGGTAKSSCIQQIDNLVTFANSL